MNLIEWLSVKGKQREKHDQDTEVVELGWSDLFCRKVEQLALGNGQEG